MIFLVIACLGLAIAAAALFGQSMVALFIAATLVLFVSIALIPALKQAISDYATCRGPSRNCSVSTTIATLGQAASMVSATSFFLAGVLQIPALGLLSNYITALVGETLEYVVRALTYSGIAGCVAGVIIMLGVLTEVLVYKSCMDN